jgi:hypothetical protein
VKRFGDVGAKGNYSFQPSNSAIISQLAIQFIDDVVIARDCATYVALKWQDRFGGERGGSWSDGYGVTPTEGEGQISTINRLVF